MTLHFSHIGLTLGRTFTLSCLLATRAVDSCPGRRDLFWLLVAVRDPPTLEVVGRDLDLDAVTREDADPVHSHLSGAVGQHLVPVLELHFERRIGEGFLDDS